MPAIIIISSQVLKVLRDDYMGDLTVCSKTSLSHILSTEAAFGIYDSQNFMNYHHNYINYHHNITQYHHNSMNYHYYIINYHNDIKLTI